MEMNRNNSNILSTGMKKFSAKPKSLTPSVLGVANSHGIKLSLNMTSQDKKELMSKLEEWRKARKDKLAARILSKQKQFEKSKVTTCSLVPKQRPPSVQNDGASQSKIRERQSVFDRLYNNSGKIKRETAAESVPNKLPKEQMMPKTDIEKSTFVLSEKPNKTEPLSKSEGNETNPEPGPTALNEVNSSPEESLSEKSELDSCTLSDKKIEKIEKTETEATEKNDESVGASEAEEAFFKPSLQREALKKFSTVPVKSAEAEKCKNPLRRSISMMFRQKCRNEYFVRRSFSAKNLNELNPKGKLNANKTNLTTALRAPLPSGAAEDKTKPFTKSVSFHTPKCERSLRTKLENWLKKNGHPLEGYRHLRCFGVERGGKSSDVAPRSDGFPGSGREAPPSTQPVPSTPPGEVEENEENKENETPSTEAERADAKEVENWLKELHRLMVELKYPSERCEEWLVAIRKKCGECTLLPIYWECLAALNESKGDLKSAIEDYERAIIKGGEVDSVGDSLEQLFEKMVIEQGKRSKPKLEKGLDPKNIFKSTIIKFALQQKALKKLSSAMDPSVREQLYVATPVRRSSRIQTPYKSSEEVVSLQTLTPELRKNVIFKPNDSLLYGD